MTDIVNAFFRRFYPPDAATNWRSKWGPGRTVMREYCGDRDKWSTIFPRMKCADGLTLSVQGHSGGYSEPRDDFADHYERVEVLGPLNKEFGRAGESCGNDEWLYGYVPIAAVEAVIAAHGGLIDMEPSK